MTPIHMEPATLDTRDLGFWGGLGVLAHSQLLAIACSLPFVAAAAAGVIAKKGWVDTTAILVATALGTFWAANSRLRKWRIHPRELFPSGSGWMRTLPWIAVGAAGQVMAIVGIYGFLASQFGWFNSALGRVKPPIDGPIPLVLVFGVLGAPIFEEILFRGVVLRGMLRRYSLPGALVASAAVFAIAHMEPMKLPTTFAMGVALGWLYVRCGSLWPSIAAHTVNNAIAFLLMGPSGRSSPMAMPLEATLGFTLGAGCFLYLAYRQIDSLRPNFGTHPATAE